MNVFFMALIVLLSTITTSFAMTPLAHFDFTNSEELIFQGAGFGDYPMPVYFLGNIPTKNAFDGATDGTGLIIEAKPGEGLMIITPVLATPNPAFIQCSVRATSPDVSIYLASIDQGENQFISTLTPNDASFIVNQYKRLTDLFIPPSKGFQAVIQVVNTSENENATVFIDNLQCFDLGSDDIYIPRETISLEACYPKPIDPQPFNPTTFQGLIGPSGEKIWGTGGMYSGIFSPDRNKIITWGSLGFFEWDAETQNLINYVITEKRIFNARYSPDGTKALTSSFDTVSLWDTTTKTLLHEFDTPSQIYSIDYSQDGKKFLAGLADTAIHIWSVESGELLNTFSGHGPYAKFSPDGTKMVSGSVFGTIKFWDVEENQGIKAFVVHDETVHSLAYSPDGTKILTASHDHIAKLWDIESEEILQTYDHHSEDLITSAIFSPSGKQVLIGYDSGLVSLWDTITGKLLHLFNQHNHSIVSLSFSSNSSRIMIGSLENISLWDIETKEKLNSLFSSYRYNAAAFSSDGSKIIFARGNDNMTLFDVETGELLQTYIGHTDYINSVLFSPDDSKILTGSWDKTIKLWDTSSGEELRSFAQDTSRIMDIAFSPFGNQFAVCDGSHEIKIWDIETGEISHILPTKSQALKTIEYSPDGKYILLGTNLWYKEISLFDASTGELIYNYDGPDFYDIAFSSDGSQFISANGDSNAILWDTSTGERRKIIAPNSQGLTSVDFSPNDKYILTVGSDKKVKIWNAENGDFLHSYNSNARYAAFSPSNQHILTWGYGEARLLEIPVELPLPAPSPYPGAPPHKTITIPLDLPVGAKPFDMMYINPGSFMMGSPEDEKGRIDVEGPQHFVTLTRGFYIAKYELTRAHWYAIMGEDDPNPEKANFPYTDANWNEIQTFIEKLNSMGYGTFRLPTEAEWEYSCRAGTSTSFYWGEDSDYSELIDYAWCNEFQETRYGEVGQKLPNAYELYDMSGNAAEWCQDFFGDYPYENQIDPKGQKDYGKGRVIRSSSLKPRFCRSAYRFGLSAGNPDDFWGFRLCREP